ncbi:response regulator transcription factor [Frankia sp. AiPs1]|uniref:response regulator transcription factor n=1 Tax=Frankia sp. AiPs1 TaxID=573493 RepID=UPI002044CAC6|nr:response regulator transcription factor [Frankia sp. AiPs1]MCM3924714.1 response regulator transcription factor [Frankia sp. AiPs1]
MGAVPGAIAVIEDDPALRRVLVRGLEAADFQVVWAVRDGASALGRVAAAAARPDALVLDLGLPDMDGMDVVSALRDRGVEAPALVLTARDALPDRLRCFARGADDYLTKPFAFAELAARLEVLVRRRRPDPGGNAIALDPLRFRLGSGGTVVPLSPTEYRLLATLLVRRGEVVRRETLVCSAWPAGAIVRENTLDSYVTRLRRALRVAAVDARLDTVRGIGYRLH